MAPEDRRCYARSLENPLRRFFSPPAREIDRLNPAPGATVADLGAGVGYFDREILDRIGPFGRLHVVDPDDENLAILRRVAGADARVVPHPCSAANMPSIGTGTVDLALLSLVLCCLVDKEGALDETWRILRPGGRALVTYPRRRRPFRRRASLRVLPDRWEELLRLHPWESLPVDSNWVIQRHLLERPGGPQL